MNPSLESTIEALNYALAVLGQADWATLCAVAEVSASESLYTELLANPAIDAVAQTLTYNPQAAAPLLYALETNDFLHFRQIHERALTVLGQHLAAGSPISADSFQQILVRLAERLINQAPQTLADLITALRHLPLVSPTTHYLDLFAAIAMRNQERYNDALTHFNRLLTQSAINDEVRGRALNGRGLTHFWQGDLQTALDDYEASLQIWEATGNQTQAGLVNLNIGIAAYELSDYGRAEHHLRTAERLFTVTQSLTWLSSVHNELGLLYRNQGRWDEALTAFQSAMARRQAEGSTHRVGVILNNIGEVLLLQGQTTAAEQAFQGALTRLASDNVRIDTLLNLGLVRQLAEQPDEALQYYEQALLTAQRISRLDILPSIHYRLGDLAARQAQPAVALHHLRTGIAQIEATRTPLRNEEMRISLLGRWQQLYDAAVLLLVAEARFDEALTLVERARVRALFEMVGASSASGAEPLAAATICQQLPADIAVLAFFATGQPGSHAAMMARLPDAAAGLRTLLLPPERLLLFYVGSEAIHCHELPVRLSQIEAQHFQRGDGRLRGIVPVPGQPLRPMRRWLDLGEDLLAPLRQHLTGKRHLVFVPHGLLHYLPLHALLNLDQLTTVTATSASYAPSASIFLAKVAQGGATPGCPAGRRLAIGVDAGGLTHAEAEARWVATQLDGALLTGEQATPIAVLQALPGAAIIHISCHGLFRQRRPLESALVVYDGEVSAADLLATVKLEASLVTLSACDTGLNRLEPGDEPLGLTRAVLGCGAHTLLATLWPVHELPTRLLMTHFYTRWLDGAGKAAALAAAQRWLAALIWADLQQQLADFDLSATQSEQLLTLFHSMLSGEHPFNHPYYWAPFVLIGDPF